MYSVVKTLMQEKRAILVLACIKELWSSDWKWDSKGLIPVGAQAVLESQKGYKTGTGAVQTASGS